LILRQNKLRLFPRTSWNKAGVQLVGKIIGAENS